MTTPAHQRTTSGRATGAPTAQIATTTRATSRRAALRACQLAGHDEAVAVWRGDVLVRRVCGGCGLSAAQRAAGEGA